MAAADGLPGRADVLVFLGEEGSRVFFCKRKTHTKGDKLPVTIRWLLDGQDHTCAYEHSPGHVHPIRCLVDR
jgi:hypothetical protein